MFNQKETMAREKVDQMDSSLGWLWMLAFLGWMMTYAAFDNLQKKIKVLESQVTAFKAQLDYIHEMPVLPNPPPPESVPRDVQQENKTKEGK